MMHTLAGTVRVETRERGSRFIATAFPAGGAEEARAGIEAVRSELPDATHHCWAYILAGPRPQPPERHHRAGDAAGTPGPPPLQALRGAGPCRPGVVLAPSLRGAR